MTIRRYKTLVTLIVTTLVFVSLISVKWITYSTNAVLLEIDTVIRAKPLDFSSVAPFYSDIITPNELGKALHPLHPYWEAWNAPTVLHAIRLWGTKARFSKTAPFPIPQKVFVAHGPDMLRYFQNETFFRSWYRETPPYFYRSKNGVGARVANDTSANAHLDDFLAVAAELGLEPNIKFEWFGGHFKLKELILHSCANYHQKQEIEFTAVALGLYLKHPAVWYNRFNEKCTYKQLVARLLEHDLKTGSCYAIHVPYGLAVLIAADRDAPFLEPDERKAIRSKLKSLSNSLEEYQSGAGFWTRAWTKSRYQMESIEEDAIEWIRSTGHHLEWIALVDKDLRPSDDVIRKAIIFTLKTLQTWPTRYLSLAHEFSPLSHAGKALLLLSGRKNANDILNEINLSADKQ